MFPDIGILPPQISDFVMCEFMEYLYPDVRALVN